MMKLFSFSSRFRRWDNRGTTAIELAFVLPVMLIFIFGVFQLGLIFEGQAGMSHALGQGARLATLYPLQSDAAIKAQMDASVFKAANFGTYTVFAPVHDVSGKFLVLEVKYQMPMQFFGISLPDIVLDKKKEVYDSSKLS